VGRGARAALVVAAAGVFQAISIFNVRIFRLFNLINGNIVIILSRNANKCINDQ
jgi:hypothetical protein